MMLDANLQTHNPGAYLPELEELQDARDLGCSADRPSLLTHDDSTFAGVGEFLRLDLPIAGLSRPSAPSSRDGAGDVRTSHSQCAASA
jgi:hypothetical protein